MKNRVLRLFKGSGDQFGDRIARSFSIIPDYLRRASVASFVRRRQEMPTLGGLMPPPPAKMDRGRCMSLQTEEWVGLCSQQGDSFNFLSLKKLEIK